MPSFEPGLVHTPLTPFKDDMSIDLDLYGRLIDFHLANGADTLAITMHVGESVSLSDAERIALLEYAIKRVRDRVPIVAHVSQSGTAIAQSLAVRAEAVGADAVICTTPYYWKPQPKMLLEHFTEIGGRIKVPFFVYNAPGEMGGVRITTDIVLQLIEQLDNFAGLVDTSLDWQYLIDLVSNARQAKPDFQLLSGLEFLISAGAIGAKGAFGPHAIIAPRLVRKLYELCDAERYQDARAPQESFARLYQVVKKRGVAGIKSAARSMGRECGTPRPPVLALSESAQQAVGHEVLDIATVAEDVRGW